MTEYVSIYCHRCGEYIAPCNPPLPSVPVICARCVAEETPSEETS